MNSITGLFVSQRSTPHTSKIETSDELIVKAPTRKRLSWKNYLKEREDIANELEHKINLKIWYGNSKESIEEREAYNKSWKKIKVLYTEINKKYEELFAIPKKRCTFCGKQKWVEEMKEENISNVNVYFCDDNHQNEFKQLAALEQQKNWKKYNKEVIAEFTSQSNVTQTQGA